LIGFILRRALLLIPTLIGVTVIAFFLSHVLPGDPARLALGLNAPAEQVAQFRRNRGLDEPLHQQYFLYLKDILRGNFGTSLTSKRPVIKDIKEYLPATLELTVTSLLLAIITGIPIGIIVAINRGTFLDHAMRGLSLIGISFPRFWLGLVLLLVFYVHLDVYPGLGRIDPNVALNHPFPRVTGFYLVDTALDGNWIAFKNSLNHLLLPAFCLSLSALARIVRITRSSMLDVMREDYVTTARAKGLSEKVVVVKHILRNALNPVLTIIGLSFGYAMGGTILIETIFAWPGMGRYAFKAVSNLDYSAIMGVALVGIFGFALVNLTIDVLYVAVDPRIDYMEGHRKG